MAAPLTGLETAAASRLPSFPGACSLLAGWDPPSWDLQLQDHPYGFTHPGNILWGAVHALEMIQALLSPAFLHSLKSSSSISYRFMQEEVLTHGARR